MKLGDRIKSFYENRTKTFLTRRLITIIRLDGKNFSQLTKGLNKPFDDGFSTDMDATAVYLCQNIQGAKFAFCQSDEISIVLTDFDNLESDAWFDYNVQKMVSVSASMATAKFNQLRLFREVNNSDYKLAAFDSRVFQVPSIDEMVNVMIWRQQDCTRNSISMAGHAELGSKAIMGKSGKEVQEMLFQEKGINWNDYKTKYKRGTIIKKHSFEIEGPNNEIVIRSKWIPVETPKFTEQKDLLYGLIPVVQLG